MLPRDAGTELKFKMLIFIMFNYTPISGNGNHLKPRKWYRAPLDENQKIEVKKEDFGH